MNVALLHEYRNVHMLVLTVDEDSLWVSRFLGPVRLIEIKTLLEKDMEAECVCTLRRAGVTQR